MSTIKFKLVRQGMKNGVAVNKQKRTKAPESLIRPLIKQWLTSKVLTLLDKSRISLLSQSY